MDFDSFLRVTQMARRLFSRELAGKARQRRRAAAGGARRSFSARRAGASGLAAGTPCSQLAQPASDWIVFGKQPFHKASAASRAASGAAPAAAAPSSPSRAPAKVALRANPDFIVESSNYQIS